MIVLDRDCALDLFACISFRLLCDSAHWLIPAYPSWIWANMSLSIVSEACRIMQWCIMSMSGDYDDLQGIFISTWCGTHSQASEREHPCCTWHQGMWMIRWMYDPPCLMISYQVLTFFARLRIRSRDEAVIAFPIIRKSNAAFTLGQYPRIPTAYITRTDILVCLSHDHTFASTLAS